MERNPYETDRYVADYLLFHYGQPADLSPLGVIPPLALEFHRRIRTECLKPVESASPTTALDLGCGVGRFTFELGCVVDRALGVDNSKAFIEAARQVSQTHAITISVKESGAAYSSVKVDLPPELQRGNVEFCVGDAQDFAQAADRMFHIVAAINLICRLPNPRVFLAQLHRLVIPGGQLVVASPYTWLEEFTPQENWVGTAEVEELLRPHFRLVHRKDLPFVIREHRRKYQFVISEVSVFLRNG